MFSPAVVSCSHGSLSLMLNRYDLLDVILAVIYESSMNFSEIDINQVMVMVIGHRRGYASWFWEVLRARGWNVVSDIFFILCNKGKAREAVRSLFCTTKTKQHWRARLCLDHIFKRTPMGHYQLVLIVELKLNN